MKKKRPMIALRVPKQVREKVKKHAKESIPQLTMIAYVDKKCDAPIINLDK